MNERRPHAVDDTLKGVLPSTGLPGASTTARTGRAGLSAPSDICTAHLPGYGRCVWSAGHAWPHDWRARIRVDVIFETTAFVAALAEMDRVLASIDLARL